MIFLTSALFLALSFLAWRYGKLAVRCALAEEKLKGQEAMEESYRSLSEEAHRSFLKAAKEDLGESKEEISKVVQQLQEQMQKLEGERKSDHGMVRQQLKTLLESEQQLKVETSNLVKALRSPVSRGRWGEIQLRRVVELAGMLNHCDFYEQVDAGGRLRPDLVVRLPGERQVVVDAKAPLEAYLDALETEDASSRLAKMKEHARHVRMHISALGKKSYWENFQPAPEFVVLFLPSEAIFSAALEHDPSLIDIGAEGGVIVATPTTLIALLRAVSYGWKQESISRHAEKVSEMGHELYKRIADMREHWSRTGRMLSSAVEAYNKATGSLEARVLVSARKFQEMGAAPATLDLPETESIDRQVRELQAFE